MPPLHIMIKPVSGACNMQCRYCFYADEANHRSTASFGIMQSDTMNTLVRKAVIYAEGRVTFSFQGGEPTVAGVEFYRDFVKTVSEYNVRGLSVSYSLQTNATLLTDEFCAFFAKHGFLIGVSLDGTKEIHDSLRTCADGKGTYSSVMYGIELLQKHGVEFNILCVMTKSVAENIKEVWKSLSVYGNIQFIPCIDGLDGKAAQFSLDAESYGNALIEIFDLYKAAFSTSSPVRERRMENYIAMLLGYPPEHCGMLGRCGVYFLCEADGSVFPCDFYVLDEWKIGNVNETSFARMVKSDVMQRFWHEGMEVPAKCRACEYFMLCRGGCRRDREGLCENRFCQSYKHFFKNRLPNMKALAEIAKKNMR